MWDGFVFGSLTVSRSTDSKEGRDGFVEWLESVDKLQLELWLDERKTFKTRAQEESEGGALRSAAI